MDDFFSDECLHPAVHGRPQPNLKNQKPASANVAQHRRNSATAIRGWRRLGRRFPGPAPTAVSHTTATIADAFGGNAVSHAEIGSAAETRVDGWSNFGHSRLFGP